MNKVAKALLAVSVLLFVMALVSLFPTRDETYLTGLRDSARDLFAIEQSSVRRVLADVGALSSRQLQQFRDAENALRDQSLKIEQLRLNRYNIAIFSAVFGMVTLGCFFNCRRLRGAMPKPTTAASS